MPGIKTEITEIATGIGALGHDLAAALADPPPQIVNVTDVTWARLSTAYNDVGLQPLFMSSWLNGSSAPDCPENGNMCSYFRGLLSRELFCLCRSTSVAARFPGASTKNWSC